MNARSVSGRGGFVVIAVVAFLIIAMKSCGAAAGGPEVVITVTGTVSGAKDDFHLFGTGKGVPAGTPFKLVFTFDRTNGRPYADRCSGVSRIVGSGKNSPGIAEMTINGKSFVFGTRPDARSKAWRSIETSCSDSEIGIVVQEGPYPLESGVNIEIHPNQGRGSLTQDKNWSGSLSLSDFDARNGDNAFAYRRPGNYAAETMSYLSVGTVTVGGR